jgi:protein TonB
MTTAHPRFLPPPASLLTRRDLIIGVLVSLALHLGVAWFGELQRPHPAARARDEAAAVIQIEMPRLEPEELPPQEDDSSPEPADLAPPMQNDVPRLPAPDSFVEPLERPQDTTRVVKRQIVIPASSGIGHGGEVYNLANLDQQPVATFQARPAYPFEMRRQGISGQVVVDFIVTAQGSVRDAYAVSSNQREFEASAVQAVAKWRFKPGRKAGRAVSTHMQVPIVFSLDQAE